jgi:HK97 gp10 family phage protein
MLSLSLRGLDELAKGLRELSQSVRKQALTSALKAAGEPMRDRMSSLAPWGQDDPHLANEIVMSFVRDVEGVKATTDGEATLAIGPSWNAFYGLFLEYGTVKMSARPFMRPAFDETSDESMAILARELWAAIEANAPKVTP